MQYNPLFPDNKMNEDALQGKFMTGLGHFFLSLNLNWILS